MTMLIFLWIIRKKYNIYKSIKLLYIKIILKTLHEKYFKNWYGINHSYVEKMNVISKYMRYKIVQKIGERLIQIRLWIEEHKYIRHNIKFYFYTVYTFMNKKKRR